MTANQVVAYNLRRIREDKGLTQEDAGELLALYFGAPWSKATFSAAERSVEGTRIRQFTADDLVALSITFEVPVTYFLMPPPEMPAPLAAHFLHAAFGDEGLAWPSKLVESIARLPEAVKNVAYQAERRQKTDAYRAYMLPKLVGLAMYTQALEAVKAEIDNALDEYRRQNDWPEPGLDPDNVRELNLDDVREVFIDVYGAEAPDLSDADVRKLVGQLREATGTKREALDEREDTA